MRSSILRISLLFLLILAVVNCAKRGSPGGGPQDITPPSVTRTSPPPNSTNFNSKKIKIGFDEYIKLDKLQQQLVISPPLNEFPKIRPQGSASKSIEITITDTLRENTTYVFNFGQSIIDNNEGNAYPFYKYVFSTGDFIDSLNINGYVTDAREKEVEEMISVLLYEIDSTYTDSIIYKQAPNYISSTVDSTNTFNIGNIRAGKYLLLALLDVSKNNVFNQKTDKIAFLEDFINIPVDSGTVFKLNLFKEISDYRATAPSLISKNRIVFGYEGLGDSIKIELLSDAPEDFNYLINKEKDKDSLNYWFTSFEADSLLFKVSHPTKIDTFNVRIKDHLYKDSLDISTARRGGREIRFEKDFVLNATTPLVAIDTSKIRLINKDSTNITFNARIDTLENSLRFYWDAQQDERYRLTLFPEAVKDFFGETNDTLDFPVNTKSYSDLGSININLQNVKSFPVIVQLLDARGDVIETQTSKEIKTNFDFKYLDPGNYNIRVIFDANGNGKWDPGSYLQKLQPERIAYFPEDIELRANWDRSYNFTLE